jgi:drug/metabolite transporter (DMT)-like permease
VPSPAVRPLPGRHLAWEAGLVAAAAVWGATFPIVKCAVERCPEIRGGLGLASVERPTTPLLFLALRFGLAAAVAAGLWGPALRGLTRRQALAASGVGLALAGGYVLQTVGLQRTSASNAGFITGLYVVLTPLLGALVLRRLPAPPVAAGALLAAAGLALLAAPTGLALRAGDALVLGCAACFAVHVLALGAVASWMPLRALVTLQLAIVALATGAASLVLERAPLPTEPGVWSAIAATGLLASVGASLLQTGAQRFVPPTRTAVILTTESLFAALFGALMLGERMTGRGWLGAALILAGMLLAEALAPARERL